jgi:Tfp pilus assembly protein PilO
MNELREKITDFLNNIDERQKYYVFGVILFLFLLLDYFLLMNPQLNALSKLNPEVKILKADIQKVKTDIKQIGQYTKNTEDVQKKMDDLGQRVLTREELPIVLAYISELANDNGLEIDQMIPNPDEQRSLLVNNGREYFTLPIEIRGRCSYHSFGKFLNQMENGEFDLRLGEFSIAGSQSQTSPAFHNVQLKVLAVVNEDKFNGGKK